MIVIDFDSIKHNKKNIEKVAKLVSKSISPVFNAEVFTLAPTEAIYWFSEETLTKEILEKNSLPTCGANFGNGSDIFSYLSEMMSHINEHSEKCGMGSFKKFKRTRVITNKNFAEIRNLGANVIAVRG